MDSKKEMKAVWINKNPVNLFIYSRISIKNVKFMKLFFCIAKFGNFNCNSTKAKDLVNFPSSLQVYALTPEYRSHGQREAEIKTVP